MLRQPAVAGQFYAAYQHKLKQQVAAYLVDIPAKEKAIAVISPHAGLVYSGKVAGMVYSRLSLPYTFVMVGPNHTGLGSPLSVFPEGKWNTPLGDVTVEDRLARQILAEFPLAEPDRLAHQEEHCLEVQLPFIQSLQGDVKIVPIVMMRGELKICQKLGSAIAKVLKPWPEPALLVASTDMTHYEPVAEARRKDEMAIQKILDLDPQGLHTVVRQHQISMCGYAPTVTVLYAALELGASRAELVHYMTSGEINGDYEQVVGYAGIMIK